MITVILSLLLSLSNTVVAASQGSLEQRATELSQQISKEMIENQKRAVAVIEFSDLKGNVTDFGRFLSEELITRLYQTKKFKVIERQLLNKVFAEKKFSSSVFADPTSTKQLGQLLGVDAIVSGTITDLAQSLRVNARLISTETGEIFAVASTEIFKDESVMKLISLQPSSTSLPAPTQKKPDTEVASGKLPTFETESYLVTAESIRRAANTINVTLTFKSLSDQTISLSWRGFPSENIYLLDENGEKWFLEGGDTAGVLWFPGYGSAELLPDTKLKTKIVFTAQGATTGTRFTLAATEGAPKSGRQITIRGLRVD